MKLKDIEGLLPERKIIREDEEKAYIHQSGSVYRSRAVERRLAFNNTLSEIGEKELEIDEDTVNEILQDMMGENLVDTAQAIAKECPIKVKETQ